MRKAVYAKAAFTYQQQLQQLKNRGLVVPDEDYLLHLLEIKSYYRLSGYWYPLLADKENHIFKSDANIETALHMYYFDKKLRNLISKKIEIIEVAIRAKMIYLFSHSYGPFWYTDASLFKNSDKHKKTLRKITEEYKRSDARFIRAYKEKYSNPFPPCWTSFEIISFGSLSTLYSNLRPMRSKRDLAHWFGLKDRTFVSWIHSLVYIRNICAHHARIWNRDLRISPQLPEKTGKLWLINDSVSNNKIYYLLSMMIFLLQSIENKDSLPHELSELLNNYPSIHPPTMGFPTDWKNEPLWSDK